MVDRNGGRLTNGTNLAKEVVYEKDGVFLDTDSEGQSCAVDGGGDGTLRIFETTYGAVIEWNPAGEGDYNVDSEGVTNDHEWAVVNPAVGFKINKISGNGVVDIRPSPRLRPFTCEVADLRSFKMASRNNCTYVTLMQRDGTTHPTLHFKSGGINGFIETLGKFKCIKESKKEQGLFLAIDLTAEALQRSLNELQIYDNPDVAVMKFLRNPYAATLTSFSKVSNFVIDCLVQGNNTSRPDHEIPQDSTSNHSNCDLSLQDEPGFEIISCDELGHRPEVSRGPPLTPEQWLSFFDSEGRLVAVDQCKEIIFRGGIMHSLRSEVWKFLLGYYSFTSTTKSRLEEKKKKTDDYFRMKLQWKSITSDQEKRFSDLRERRNLIEKDVNRTDRVDPYYSGEDNENVRLLYDILMTYCMYNFDLGYVQGMSDLLSPILLVMQNEVDAFWCFAYFMERMCSNFEMDQQGIKTQLFQLHTLLNYVDMEFTTYLDSRDSGNLYFCFRWLLILFKREFKFQDIMRLWEVFWTDLPCKNFHLLFCLAILDAEKKTVTESKFGFTEILKHMNDISYHINLEDILCKAESIYLQIKEGKNSKVLEILGLPPVSNPFEDVQDPCSTNSNRNFDDDLERQCEEALSLQYL